MDVKKESYPLKLETIFARLLKMRRKERGLSQETLALMANVDRRLEAGKGNRQSEWLYMKGTQDRLELFTSRFLIDESGGITGTQKQ